MLEHAALTSQGLVVHSSISIKGFNTSKLTVSLTKQFLTVIEKRILSLTSANT